jgi:hypothetical protein
LLRIGFSDESIRPPRRQWLGISAALCVQTAVVRIATGHIVDAAMLTLVSSLAWAWLFSSYEGLSPGQTRRALLVSAVCVLLSASFLLYLRSSEGSGRFGIPYPRGSSYIPQGRHGPKDQGVLKGNTAEVSDAYVGILLWPEKQRHTKLIAPLPLSFKQHLFGNDNAKRLVIPFDGVYWFYRAPDNRPPLTSHEAHGSPETVSIRSTDRRPLRMEAHQNLGTLINLNCCSRIEIAIRNADRYRESVSLELVITDSASPDKESQSLGRAMVRSTRPWKLYDDRPPTTETLSFVVPANLGIHRFDEITVVFRLDADRADAGAKIGIDHFTLLPRGL